MVLGNDGLISHGTKPSGVCGYGLGYESWALFAPPLTRNDEPRRP
jgi:hypothetical protein